LEQEHIEIGKLRHINGWLEEAGRLATSSRFDMLIYLIEMARIQAMDEIIDREQRLKANTPA
jgi:hypothetical protein